MVSDELVALVREAALAPSVHNVQPARWRIGDGTLTLIEDMRCRLAAADPNGHDAAISLGTVAEGLRLAASRAGRGLRESEAPHVPGSPFLRPVRHFALAADKSRDPLVDHVEARQSWRGHFQQPTSADRTTAAGLATDDAAIVIEQAQLRDIAQLYDQASFGFMQRGDFRRELVSWMRFSRSHPRWAFDGLNAEAMALGKVEALGAGMVLGPMFNVLDSVGLAKTLTAEGAKIANAAAVVVFHRPIGEDPFVSGGHFYRCWLRITAAGFAAAVLAALADDRDSATNLASLTRLPPSRRIVSAFRIGRRPLGAVIPRARRPLDEILV